MACADHGAVAGLVHANLKGKESLHAPVGVSFASSFLPLLADEGMWPFNDFPKDRVRQKYGVAVSDELLDHLRRASVRAGASGSFVSAKGLIFTNHHVVLGCVQEVSSKEHDYVAGGFLAKSPGEEKKCPGLEANVLLNIVDITSPVKNSIRADPASAEGNAQRRAALSRLENECSSRTGNRCQAVTLYGGARYDLYEYRKYTDVRLVFAPEFQAGFFGGDPDNFTYPRYCLDIGFFRAYENDRPAETPHYLKFSREGVRNNDVVFVSGNPGRTERLLTVAEAEYARDVRFPYVLEALGTNIRALKAFMALSPENTRVAKDQLMSFENSYKALNGEYGGLKDPRLMDLKRADEKKLRDAIAAGPAEQAAYARLWDDIAAGLAEARQTFVRRQMLEGGAYSDLFNNARTVLRLPEENARPAAERLREYAGSGLASIEHRLYSPAPVTPSLEIVLIATYFERLQQRLGPADEIVMKILNGRTPRQAAEYYVNGSKLGDAQERKRLATNLQAMRASSDTMLELVRILDGPAREIRKRFESTAEAVLNAAKPRLAEARFAAFGTGEAPDATFTLRLSYGQVRGYEDHRGREVPYATVIGGLYQRATGRDPYLLPPAWIKAKSKLNLSTPYNFVSTADIIGGNSGSPTVNAKGEIVGIVFDGNIESLPNNFQYTETQARAVHVASQAILEVLRKVYSAGRILDELGFPAAAAAAAAGGAQEPPPAR
jgi:hypothetical protein